MTRDGIQALIAEDVRLRGLKRELDSRAREFEAAQNPAEKRFDPGHDLAHSLRVAIWTIRLGQSRLDPACAIAAALLHDVVNVPKDSPDRSRASELSADYAASILPKLGFAQSEVEEICEAVREHSFSRGGKPTRLLGKCLQDADRLESLGSIGIMRCISTGTLMKAHYFHPSDPWAQKRELDDRKFSVDHFFTKLFKLPELMNTSTGREEADRRVETMKLFLQHLGEELGDPL